MKLITKKLPFILLIILALIVVACGGGAADEGGQEQPAATEAPDETAAETEAEEPTEETAAETEGSIWVLLPDSASSARWETDDRRFFEAAFEAAGVEYNIVNAEGDARTQQTQAEQAITAGAKVILLVNLDSGSGAAIIALAREAGVAVWALGEKFVVNGLVLLATVLVDAFSRRSRHCWCPVPCIFGKWPGK
jgi:D-xylose transport system substrate-binding protein